MSTHCGTKNTIVENDIMHCRSAPLPAEHIDKGKEKEATIPHTMDDKNYSFACPDTPPNTGLVKVPSKSALGNCHLPILTTLKQKASADSHGTYPT